MSDKSFDVAALGEPLIDFTQNGLSQQGNSLFEANPGGAPCNVLAMLRKLDKRCAFLGKVGQDGFGQQLAQVVKEAGIDTRALRFDPEIHTTLAIVQTLPGGATGTSASIASPAPTPTCRQPTWTRRCCRTAGSSTLAPFPSPGSPAAPPPGRQLRSPKRQGP